MRRVGLAAWLASSVSGSLRKARRSRPTMSQSCGERGKRRAISTRSNTHRFWANRRHDRFRGAVFFPPPIFRSNLDSHRMFLFHRHPQRSSPESSFRGDSDLSTSIRLADGGIFRASQNLLSEVHSDGDSFIYYRGWPATDLSERKTIFEKWEAIFGDNGFTVARGSYLLVLIDTARSKLKVLRDPWGSVPVYYTESGDIVSDQITSVITLKGASAFSPAPLAEYLSSSYIAGSRML